MSFTRSFNVISYATQTIRQSPPIGVLSKNMQYKTAKELATEWRVTPESVRRWARIGAIECVRVGKLLRFPIDATPDFNIINKKGPKTK